jgi:hypothetical protein
MEPALLQAIEELRGLTIAALQDRYREAFAEPARSSNKQLLFRRLAWQLQAAHEGGLSERACRRAAMIADDAAVEAREPANSTAPPSRRERLSFSSSRPQRDARLPPPGTLLARRFQGKEVLVKVLDQGFEYQARQYYSLSAIARQVTGTRWNGFAFFGLTGRRDG